MKFRNSVFFFDMLLPVIILLFCMVLFHQSRLDYLVASHFYNLEAGWGYRDSWPLEAVLHKGGVKLVALIFLGILGYLIYSYKNKHKKSYILCIFILMSSLISILIVFLLKNLSTFPCPWNAVEFGGTIHPVSFLDIFSSKLSRQHCFPAGHASGGYAFLSLYYGYCFIYGKRNFRYLIPGVSLGFIFGITQQIRGAHYLSHDFSTIIISIFSAWMTYLILNKYNKLYEL